MEGVGSWGGKQSCCVLGVLSTLVTVGAVSALAASLAGRAHESLLTLARAGAIDAILAHPIPGAGAPGLPWARLALLPEETRAALPGLQTQKCCSEGQGGMQGGQKICIFTGAFGDRKRENGFKLRGWVYMGY